jgi:hypothetical protein
MRFTNPVTRAFRFQKAWFFFKGDVQHVLVSAVSSAIPAPIRSVLDQKKRLGPIYVNGQPLTNSSFNASSSSYTSVKTLWHADVGYLFDDDSLSSGSSLVVETGVKTGSWKPLGISTQPNTTVDLFTAYIAQSPLQFDKRLGYSVYSGRSYRSFRKALGKEGSKHHVDKHLITIHNDAGIRAVLDPTHHTIGIVFWQANGGKVVIPLTGDYGPSLILCSDQAVTLIVRLNKSFDVTVSNPSQTLTSVKIKLGLQRTLRWGDHLPSSAWIDDEQLSSRLDHLGHSKTIQIQFPQGEGIRGSSITRSLWR